MSGDLSVALKSEFKFGNSMNQTFPDGNTRLTTACYNCEELLVTSLVKNQFVDVNKVNGTGHSPLMLAVSYGTPVMISALLERTDLDVNYNIKGLSALTLAVYENKHEVVATFLDDFRFDFSLIIMDSFSVPELMFKNRFDMGPLLKNRIDVKWDKIFMFSASKGDSLFAAWMIKHAPVYLNCTDENGNTPLMLACKNGHTNVAVLLFSMKGVNVNHLNRAGESLVDILVQKENGALMCMLVESEFSLLGDEDMIKIFHYACRKCDFGLARVFITNEFFDVNSKGPSGWNALGICSSKEDVSVLKLLLCRRDLKYEGIEEDYSTPEAMKLINEKKNARQIK